MESEVFLEPEPQSWAGLAMERRDEAILRGTPVSQWRPMTRRELQLPGDKTTIAVGHQATFWHPGVLAKFMAADAVVESIGRERACALHLVVDHEDNDCTRIEVPVIDRQDVLSAQFQAILRLPAGAKAVHTSAGSHLDRPTGEFPALEPVDAAGYLLSNEMVQRMGAPALDSIPDSLRRVESALRTHRDAPSLARQVVEAVQDQLVAWMTPPMLLFASRLLQTSFGRAMVEEMARDPAACAQHYNEAVGTGEGDVRPLERRDGDWELPLWRVDADRRRQPVFASEIAYFDSSSFRPRALLMTAIMRLVVCDLFIHGRGGIAYDRAMEKWIGAWLGLPVYPMTMATADLRLTIPRMETVSERDLARAISADYRFRHDPESKRGEMSAAKRQWLSEIDALPRHSRERRQRFIEYHRWLTQSRAEHKVALDASYFHLVHLCRKMKSRNVLARRDWAFPLYPREMLDALNAAIRARIGSRSSIVNRQSSISGPPDQPTPAA